MKPAPRLNAAAVIGRLKLLPRRHRIAHLRALLRRSPACWLAREQLAASLCGQTITRAANENRAT
jgi:hypothetical protein